MKRYLALLLAILALFSLVACGNIKKSGEENDKILCVNCNAVNDYMAEICYLCGGSVREKVEYNFDPIIEIPDTYVPIVEVPEFVSCPYCLHINVPDAVNCGFCGKNMSGDSDDNIIVCTSCGAENASILLYCLTCGSSLEENDTYVIETAEDTEESLAENRIPCFHCGVENNIGSKFCGNCGKSMSPYADTELEYGDNAVCSFCYNDNDINMLHCNECGALMYNSMFVPDYNAYLMNHKIFENDNYTYALKMSYNEYGNVVFESYAEGFSDAKNDDVYVEAYEYKYDGALPFITRQKYYVMTYAEMLDGSFGTPTVTEGRYSYVGDGYYNNAFTLDDGSVDSFMYSIDDNFRFDVSGTFVDGEMILYNEYNEKGLIETVAYISGDEEFIFEEYEYNLYGLPTTIKYYYDDDYTIYENAAIIEEIDYEYNVGVATGYGKRTDRCTGEVFEIECVYYTLQYLIENGMTN